MDPTTQPRCRCRVSRRVDLGDFTLATRRSTSCTGFIVTGTSGHELGLKNVRENEIYQAMDWLYARKEAMLEEATQRDGVYVIRTHVSSDKAHCGCDGRHETAGEGGEGLSQPEDDRTERASDPPLQRAEHHMFHLPVHVGLLRGVAHVGDAISHAVCRRRPGGSKSAPVSLHRPAFPGNPAKGAH